MRIEVVAKWPVTYGSDESVLSEPEFVFAISTSGIAVRVVIQREERSFTAEYEHPVSDALRSALLSVTQDDDTEWTEELKTEADKARATGVSALNTICSWMKYHLNIHSIPENAHIERTLFNLTDGKVVAIPPRLRYIGRAVNQVPLNDKSAALIERHISSGHEPFVAMRHLHRAKHENVPRYKWIDATIAAELAIKEFLIRKVPEYEALLLELPAPPLVKLYGVILESVIKERSPKLKELARGVEIRNRLVHRPNEEAIDDQRAIDYCEHVEVAIYHLLTKLYPDDFVADKICSKRLAMEIA